MKISTSLKEEFVMDLALGMQIAIIRLENVNLCWNSTAVSEHEIVNRCIL
jgi:hypothetical protein